MSQIARRDGYALITSLIVTVVVTGLVIGFISTLNTEQKIARNDTDYSSAFYAAEAGLEKLNSDLSKLFQQSVFPTQSAINGIQASSAQPQLDRVTYSIYSVSGGQSTTLGATLEAVVTTATVVSTGGWPASGFFMVDAEEIAYTGKDDTHFTGLGRTGAVKHANNASVSRSKLITLTEGPNAGLNAQVIPFTLDVAAQAGAGSEARLNREVQVALIPVFQFGVFSDSDLSFFAGPIFNFGGRVHTNGNLFLAAGSGTTLAQKVTVAAHVIRAELANGVSSEDRTGPVYVLQSTGSCNPAPGACRDLQIGEGSKKGGPASDPNKDWTTISLTTYNGNILNVDTGAKALTLPFVGGNASTIEIIRRPPANEDATSLIGQSRLYNQASLRILISDTTAKLPGNTGVPLNGNITGAPWNYSVAKMPTFRPQFARADPNDVEFLTAANADETTNAELVDGFIKIERQNADATWTDVTTEILNYGISTNQTDAILRFQKPRWDAADGTNSIAATDYSPINLYDARESHWRTTPAPASMPKIGIMNLVELDVARLAQWFAGTLAGSTGGQAVSNNGYIVYFSDRRGNRDGPGNETGEFGFEDTVNPTSTDGVPNGTLDAGEDLNGNGTLETYGANLPYQPWGTASADLYTTTIGPQPSLVAMDLSRPVDAMQTSIDVGSVANMSTNGYYRIGNEIVSCVNKDTSNPTDTLGPGPSANICTRGVEGTTAAAHSVAFAELTADIDATQTNVDVNSIAGLTTGFYRVLNEYMYCTVPNAGTTLTCQRGRLGSTATAHNRLWNSVNENLDATETGIDVTSATNFEVPGYYRVDNEILNCTSKSGNTLTCARGALGTTAATHDGRSTLSAAITGTSTQNIAVSNGSSFIVPGYFNIDNEVVNCPTKSSNTLQNCTRGQRGTLAATHANSVNIRPSIDSIEIGEVQVWPYQRAAKNRVHYFRRALRLVNGSNNVLPQPGFTVASENPVYVLGNYNAGIGSTGFDGPHSSAAIIADAVTLLSNAWNDNNSFQSPDSTNGRVRSETNYRMAIAAGKGINFTRPDNYTGDGDFGTDGGTHNFLRYLEQGSASIWYRGSIVSLYYYRQATGTYKCCSAVYAPPGRQYAFDLDFLVPLKLPPGTPRFRDINNLSFRQTIRADQ